MSLAAATVVLFLAVTPEGADSNLVAPRIGLAGGVGGTSLSDGVLRVDVSVGGEWRRRGDDALGFDVQFALLRHATASESGSWSSVHLGGNLVWASRFADEKPFGSVSTGPLFAASWRGLDNLTSFGGGWQLEGAVGFKSLAELFCAATLSVDRLGLLPALVVGARLNLLLLVKFLAVVERAFNPRHLGRELLDGNYK